MTLDLVFARQKEQKRKMRDLKKMIRDGFANSKSYQETNDQLELLKKKKAQIEMAIREEYAAEIVQIDKLRLSIAQDGDLMTDMAVSQMMKGETVEVKDENEVKYEPKFKVSFKKS